MALGAVFTSTQSAYARVATGPLRALPAHEAATCTANTVFLFTVRGSGETKTDTRLLAWISSASSVLSAAGWMPQSVQASYTAPSVPLEQIGADFEKAAHANFLLRAAALADAAVRSALLLRSYRDTATRESPAVVSQLAAMSAACPHAPIFIGSYSLGGIVLRYVVPRLPASVLDNVEQVDLIADPTADERSDAGFVDSGPVPQRTTAAGIDTFVARLTHADIFRQTRYPSALANRIYPYCNPYDLVCDANVISFIHAGGEAARHAGYPFANIGAEAAGVIGHYTPPAPALSVTTPAVSVTTPPPAPTVPASGPTVIYQYDSAGNFYGGDLDFTDWAGATDEEADTESALPSDLDQYRCVVLDLNESFNTGDEGQLMSYLQAGGTIIVLGEHSDGDGFDFADAALNGMVGELGGSITLNDDSNDAGDTESDNIDSSPLTSGVSSIGYNWASSVTFSGSAEELIASGDDSYSLVVEQSVNGGTIVVSGDSNAFSDNNDGFFYDDDNGQFVADLCP